MSTALFILGSASLILASYAQAQITDTAQAPQMPVDKIGKGAPLVLIGGGLTGWASWEPHALRLSESRSVFRLQLLSVQYGLEGRSLPENYSVRMESQALARSLDAQGLHVPVDFAAWSFGALVTLDFALNYPDRVRTLTLIEPPALWILPGHGRDSEDVRTLENLYRGFGTAVSEDDLEAFARLVGLLPSGQSPQSLPFWPFWMSHRQSLLNIASVFQHHDTEARVRNFSRPVLLVTGTATAPFLRRIHDALASSLPLSVTTEMPAGHAPHIVSQDRFLQELASFQANAE